MCKRLILLLCFVVGLGLANSALAALWTGNGDGTSWDDASNWDPAAIPGSSEQVDMNTPERGPIIDVDVECGVVQGPVWDTNTPMVLDIIEGNVRFNGWRFAEGGTGIGTVNISGGNVNTGGDWRWGDSTGSYGIVNISGGTVTCPRIKIGDDGGGELHISGSGVLMNTGDSDFAGNAPNIITMDGGTYTTLGKLNGGSQISYTLYAGTMECGEYEGGSSMDIEEGQFIVGGDETTALNAAVDAGDITAYGEESGDNDCEVHVDYDSDLDKTIVTATTAYTWARNPSPSTGAQNLCPDDVELSWTAAVDATHHDVYIGTDETAVENATTSSDEFKGRQTGTTYNPEGPDELVAGVTYYWRIDEFDGSSVVPGDVWNFTTNDGTAYDPDPAHNVKLVDIEADLSWSAGCDALSHNVYFGTDFNDVNDADTNSSVHKGNQSETTFEPGTLEISTFYYWRIDEVETSETLKGRVWKFRSRGNIIDANMVVWYTFDEDFGSIAADSSGYERHASAIGEPEAHWEPNEGRFGGAVRFDTDDSYAFAVPIDTLGTVTSAVSVSVWVNGEVGADDTVVVFDAGDSGLDGANKLTGMVPNSGGAVSFRAGDDVNDVLVWSEVAVSILQGEWHHFVFVKDEVADSMSIYFNAQKIASKSDVSSSVSGLGNKAFHIGAENTSSGSDHAAAFDDFRVFDKALTDSEIAGLFRGGDVDTAWAPSPYNGEPDVDRDSMLKWRPGDSAAFHDVYFGTNFDDVNDATTSTSSVYKGRLGPNEYDPGTMSFGQTYYWRVDEVNDPCVWRGQVWKFTAANFIIIDDFESYNDSDPIYSTWSENAGAILDDFYPGDPTHSGEQSMWFLYFNDYGPDSDYSEVGRDLGVGGMDCTQAGVKALTMFFYGDPTNDAGSTEEPYVGIDDGSTYAESRYLATGNPISDIQEEEWHEWNIAISDLNSVTLTAVENIYIGFGQRGSSVEGGCGEVYFDDVRLYLPRCVASERSGDFASLDFSGNCIIDYADIAIMANRWLCADACVPVTAPPTGPVAWWELDDGSGTTATDSTTNNNNGTLEGSTTWVAGHIGTGAVEFGSDDARIRVPYSAELMPPTVSVTAWIYPTQEPDYSARIVAKGVDLNDWETYYLQFNGAASWTIRDPNHENHALDGSDLSLNEWIHFGGTYDGNAVKLYVNGQLDAEDTTGGLAMLHDTNDLCIGNRSDGNDRAFVGTIDDVRVYNYALSGDEVAYIATQTTGYVPLNSRVNIYDEEPRSEKVVNFRDFAVLLNSWLNKEFWPFD